MHPCELITDSSHVSFIATMKTFVAASMLLFLAMVACPSPVRAFSRGAPSGACSSLSPSPGPQGHDANPQSSPVPYTIDLAVFDDGNGSLSYQPGMTYQREPIALAQSCMLQITCNSLIGICLLENWTEDCIPWLHGQIMNDTFCIFDGASCTKVEACMQAGFFSEI